MLEEEFSQKDSEFSHISIQNSINQEVAPPSGEVEPWMSQDTREIKNPNIRFHNEIIDFFDYVLPKKREHEKKRRGVLRVMGYLEKEFPGAKLVPFGSFLTELYLPNSDIDLLLLLEDQEGEALA